MLPIRSSHNYSHLTQWDEIEVKITYFHCKRTNESLNVIYCFIDYCIDKFNHIHFLIGTVYKYLIKTITSIKRFLTLSFVYLNLLTF